MRHNYNNISGGVDFASLLTVLFVGLKLTGYITWNWWWVLSPLWLTCIVVMVVMSIITSVWPSK